MTSEYHVADLNLATGGKYRIEWAEQEMPVLRPSSRAFRQRTAAEGLRVSACLHVTTETANLMHTCKRAARIWCCAPPTRSPRRTMWRPSLVSHYEIPVYAIKGEDNDDLLPAHQGGA